jgi:hypothetical protein
MKRMNNPFSLFKQLLPKIEIAELPRKIGIDIYFKAIGANPTPMSFSAAWRR